MVDSIKRKSNLKWYYKNREYQIQKNREWKEKNREHMLAQKKEYHFKNRERILLKKKQFRELNKEKIRLYRELNKERDRKKEAEYRQNNIEKERIRHAKYSKEHPEQILKNQINSLKKLGLSLNMAHFKTGMALKTWSQTIRNNFVSCKICADKATHSHHLFYKQYYPKLALNINNGIPLCKIHHDEVHGFNLRNGGRR